MKSVVWLLILCAAIIAPVSAYQLMMDCPTEIYVGQTIKVIGNSTLPAGTSFDLVLYETQYTSTAIERRTVTLQDVNSKTFIVPFSTKGLRGGMYKIEVQSTAPLSDRLSADSVTEKIIKVLDRSSEITITAPITQTMDEALRIEGSISKLGNEGVQIEVRGPQGPVFGPTWVETKKEMKLGDGEFAKKIPANTAGEYEVQFTDAKGYIGAVTLVVVKPTPVATTIVKTTAVTATTRPPATTTTPVPTPTQSPLSPLLPLVSLGITGGVAIFLLKKKMV